MLASFIILYHPTRLDNLEQTIRFLKKREKKLLDQEFIFVCQTSYNLEKYFLNQINLNLNLKNYHKSLMTNLAVKKSSGEFLVLMDSDRILPNNFFYNSIFESTKNSVTSTIFLYQLDKPYTDAEIDLQNFKKTADFRKKNIEGRFKNLFSGNTVLSKCAYNKLHGYDESFVGYGFADNDMSKKALVQKLEIKWRKEEELHLYHEKTIYWNNEIINKDVFKIITAINAFNYYKKWNLKIDKSVRELIEVIEKNISKFPNDLQHAYKQKKIDFLKIL